LQTVTLARLRDILDRESEQPDPAGTLRPVPTLEGRVTLTHVGFRYPAAPDVPILEDVSVDVLPGTTVAIVGRSGSGKSTLLKCLAGLLQATKGSIAFDAVDLRELRWTELRRRIGFVPQRPYVFDDTLARNIAFGEDEPDMDAVRAAAAIADVDSFAERLPLGYRTRVGEGGMRLSGGQSQRLAIARSIFHRPSVLLLDEATSALDSEAERTVTENMRRLLEGRTAFVVAHRLSTVRDADLILVLEAGRVAETGTHDELFARDGLYVHLYGQQLAGS
jgi:ATP-binding cassette subfamily B protein